MNEQSNFDQTQIEQTNQNQNNFEQPQDNQLHETLADQPVQNEQLTYESVQDDTAQEPTKQELNFRELREQAKQAKRERDELKAYLERLKQQENPGNWQPQAQKQKPEPDDDYNLREDDFIEGRHFKKFLKKQKELEEKVKQYESQSQSISVEMQLKSKYRDFDDVVNQKTVDKLRDEYPEVFTTIQTSSDLYNKGAAAYRIIKQLGLAGNNTTKTEQQIIKSNTTKPQNPNTSSAPNSPLNQANLFANGLTPELKEKLRRANLEAIRRRNS